MSTTTTALKPMLIELPAPLVEKAERRAVSQQKEITEYIRQLIEKDVQRTKLDDLMGPVRQQVEAASMTDSEIDLFFDEVREEVWKDQQAQLHRHAS